MNGRYSPAEASGRVRRRSPGIPTRARQHSYAERANLTMRMHMRRFTRLTNAFSKKFENHAHSMALIPTYYFLRIHNTLNMTPAMAAGGVSDRLWEVSDIVALLEASETKPGETRALQDREAKLTPVLSRNFVLISYPSDYPEYICHTHE